MKKYLVYLLLVFISIGLIGQNEISLTHCDCVDLVEEQTPELNGDYKRLCNGKVVEEGEFDNGLKIGEWLVRSKNGQVIRKFNYVDGRLDGEVVLNYPNGKVKLKGRFENSLKNGKWEYFNDKGKVIKEGSYLKGNPKGVWKVYDWKGKKVLIEYDFEQKKYLKSNFDKAYFEEAAVLQNDNSAEWFILSYPEREGTFNEKPIEGYDLLNDLYVNLMEIPLDFWETFLSSNYYVKIKFDDGAMKDVDLYDNEKHLDNVPVLSFIVITNDLDKLDKIDHSELSMKLLEYKIKEAVWLLGPWIGIEDEIKIYTPYVINQLQNRKF